MPVPKILVTAALMAANMALTLTKTTNGPRLDDLKFTDGDYGASLANVWGLRRLEVPIFWAENLREVKRRSKTKGGKYNEYKYYGTWAVALAAHEIDAVTRIWFDTHLVYDLTGAGPVTPFDFGGIGSSSDYITIYTGTSVQEADPRMQATVEAEFGAGSCPAYRDTAYIVFKDIPLEKLGNRIPQVSVEMVSASSDAFPMTSLATPGRTTSNFVFTQDYAILAAGNRTGVVFIDTAASAIISSSAFSPFQREIADGWAVLNDGSVLYGDSTNDLYSKSLDGPSSFVLAMAGATEGTTMSTTDGDGNEYWIARTLITPQRFYLNGATIIAEDVFGADFADFYPTMMFRDTFGEVWVCGASDVNSPSALLFWRVSGGGDGPSIVTVYEPDITNISNVVRAFHYSDATSDHFVVRTGGDLYLVGRLTGTVLDSYTPEYNGFTRNAAQAVVPGAPTFWSGFEEISSADLTQVRSLDARDWDDDLLSQHRQTVYDPINHALIDVAATDVVWYYLDRVAPDGVLLSTIAGDVADMCGVEDYDFSDLDQVIEGWNATHGPGQNMIEPLLDVYDSDFRPAGFEIEGIKRTGVSSGATLSTAWFTGEPRYKVTMRQAVELPRAMLIDFADTAAEQQKNSVRVDRPLDATEARTEKKVDLTPLALNVDDARELADRYFRRTWAERKEIENGLTAKELGLEPGDVRTLDLDGTTVTARCTSLMIGADDKLTARWKFDAPTLASLIPAVGATFDGRDDASVLVPILSKGFVLDTGLIEDADEATTPIVYVLAAPYATGAWPGAAIYQQTGDEYTDELAAVPSSSDATWGIVEEAFAYANPNLWDRGTEITVTLNNGSLVSATEADINADPTLNLAAIGADGRWELVQFTNATLDSGTTYTLSGFKRGRRGTEWAAELHEASDRFVLLDTAQDEALGLSEVSTDLSFKAITLGRTEAGAFPFAFSFTGASMKPYAPAHVYAVKESSGDWTIYGTRRTRVGGAWTGGSTIPLGEDSEAYSLDLGDGIATVTKTTSSLPYTWDVATQTSDTGAEVTAGNLEAAVYQVSASVCRGYGTETTA